MISHRLSGIHHIVWIRIIEVGDFGIAPGDDGRGNPEERT
jgi:hypothetical protein